MVRPHNAPPTDSHPLTPPLSFSFIGSLLTAAWGATLAFSAPDWGNRASDKSSTVM
ncbi:hypothetical protein [Archangium minus]|uniref:hypothetical protein n=1 Tax=Archangium minus TaxID=83450 RepID=UPI0037BF7A17